MLVIFTPEPKRTDSVDTTLSLAIKPVINAVEILQSPNQIGLNICAIKPAIVASMLSCEFSTRLNLVSKVCKNQITIVATKITVNAL